MSIRAEENAGDTLRLESKITKTFPFEEGEESFDPDDVTYEITNFDGETVDEGDLSRNDDGEYYILWNTEGLEPGDYDVTVLAESGANREKDKFTVRLTNHDG